jgi:hypothetical protein
MIDLSQSENFHDSNLIALEVDLVERRLTCHLEAYLSPAGPRELTPIVLRFENVRCFSVTADLLELQQHARFGNIADWSPRKGFNLIMLAAGAITFEADGFEVSDERPREQRA